METLKEIINVITKNTIKNIEVIGRNSNGVSKINELYEGIQSGKFSNDQEAASYFYGSNPKDNSSYIKLKNRLQKRLINTVFFIDTNQASYNDLQRAYYNGYRDWAAVKILLGKAARRTAIPIAKRIIKNAVKFEFSDLALDVARTLRTHYATFGNDQKKYELYNKYVKKYNEILNAELLAEEYFQKITSSYNSGRLNASEIEQLAIKYAKELRNYTSYLQSYRLNLNSFLTFALRYQIVNDYRNIEKECEKAVHFFESKKYQASKNAIFLFLFKNLACCIQLKEFKKGEIIAKRCLELLNEGIRNWFLTLEKYLILSFHTNNLVQAYQIFCNASENKNFSNLYKNTSENWRTHEAYIHYFLSIGAIKLPPNEKIKLKPFRLSRFLNDMPVHSKDKHRRNIPILIIHVLFLLQKRQFEKVIDRVDSLNLYSYRYLRKDDTFRSNCFIKMLLQLPKANFHREAVNRKAKKYYDKLIENPSNLKMQAGEIEIMPYEMLWEYVLDSLDNKVYSGR